MSIREKMQIRKTGLKSLDDFHPIDLVTFKRTDVTRNHDKGILCEYEVRLQVASLFRIANGADDDAVYIATERAERMLFRELYRDINGPLDLAISCIYGGDREGALAALKEIRSAIE